MAKKTRELAPRAKGEITPRPANIIQPETGQEGEGIPLPEAVKGMKGQEAPSNLTPIVEFNRVGEWVYGEYLGYRPEVGPNKSNLYDLRIDGTLVASVWGSVALDTKMNRLNPKVGDSLLIQYLGDVPTSRGLNPVKTFRVVSYPKG